MSANMQNKVAVYYHQFLHQIYYHKQVRKNSKEKTYNKSSYSSNSNQSAPDKSAKISHTKISLSHSDLATLLHNSIPQCIDTSQCEQLQYDNPPAAVLHPPTHSLAHLP